MALCNITHILVDWFASYWRCASPPNVKLSDPVLFVILFYRLFPNVCCMLLPNLNLTPRSASTAANDSGIETCRGRDVTTWFCCWVYVACVFCGQGSVGRRFLDLKCLIRSLELRAEHDWSLVHGDLLVWWMIWTRAFWWYKHSTLQFHLIRVALLVMDVRDVEYSRCLESAYGLWWECLHVIYN